MIGLLRRLPRNHLGGSTNTLKFGGGFSTSGDYERELAYAPSVTVDPLMGWR